MLRAHAGPGERSLSELVEAFEEMGDRLTVVGWTRGHTVRRIALERAIAALVQAPLVPWSGTRIRCSLDVAVELRDGVVESAIRAVTRGGVLVDRWTKLGGSQVTFHWQAPSGARRLPVRGEVVGIDGSYLRVALPRLDDVADRWTRRLVVDALRSRVEWRPSARATLT